ncbi:hypothetical protein BC829DRAFT_489808 [Chytridium lagenaria]|nr:hypothetical protein BC829DRAFT_489808 [Chytridium lagenaria]
MHRTHPLYPLPVEIRRSILRFTNDLSLAVTLESIWLNLPALHPEDPMSAFDDLGINTPFFPVSKDIAKRFNKYSNLEATTDLALCWLYRMGLWHRRFTWILAACGRLEFLRWLHQQTLDLSSNARADQLIWTEDVMIVAASEGHLDVVQFLHETRKEGCTTEAMDMAAAGGHLDVVRFLHERRQEGCTSDAMDMAAGRGHLDVVRFLHERRQEGCTSDAMDMAAGRGHLDVNRQEGCTTEAMDLAAGEGHLDVILYLHENRQEGCTSGAMDMAAERGHLEVVRFLNENLDEAVNATAATSAVKYSINDISPPDQQTPLRLTAGEMEYQRSFPSSSSFSGLEIALSTGNAKERLYRPPMIDEWAKMVVGRPT